MEFLSIWTVQYFQVIPILSPLCIAAAELINDLSHIVTNKNIRQKIAKYFSGIATSKSHIKNIDELFSVAFPLIIISVIAIQD